MKTNLKISKVKALLYVMFAIIFYFNSSTTINAQTGNATDYLKHSVPQPEAMCLINQMNLSNSLHTGAVNTNIPLYNIQGDMLNLPISLSYISNGIKVDEEASRVGLGWQLNAGGRVTRVIRGIEDEHFSSDINLTTAKLTYPNFKGKASANNIAFEGWLHDYEKPEDDNNTKMFYDKVSTDVPDLFYYSVANLSGKFTINKDGTVNQMPYNNVEIEPILGSDDKSEKFDIETSNEIDIEDRIIGFTIKDETGRIFTFSEEELSSNVEWSPLFDDEFNIPTDLFGERTTSWNISQIKHVANKETIDFEYDLVSFDSNSITTNHKLVEGDDCLCKQPTASTTSSSSNQGKILKSIKWNHGRIDFEPANREDIPGDKHYSRMDISLNTVDNPNITSIVKSFQFNTSYFNNNAIQLSNQLKRLKLTGLQELGADGKTNGKPAYVFTYNDTALPQKNSNQRDLWGYFNGVDSNTGIPNIFDADGFGKDRLSAINPDSTKPQRTLSVFDNAKAGILTSVTNPMGGSTTFDYELNHFNYFNEEYLGAGLRVASKTVSDGVNTSNDIVYNYNYTQVTDNTSTSGFVTGIPIYGHLCKKANTNAEFYSNAYRSSRRLDYPIGNEVGYNRVTVSNYTGGFTEYVFNSALEFPDLEIATEHTESCDAFLGVNDHFPHASKTSFDYKRGLLLSEKVFNTDDEDNEDNDATIELKYSMVNQYQFNNKATETVTIELNAGENGNTGQTTSTRTITADFIALKKQTETLDGVEETITDMYYNSDSKLRQTYTKINDNDINFTTKIYITDFTYIKHNGQNRIDIKAITNKVNSKVVDKTIYNYMPFGSLGPFVKTVNRQENTFNSAGTLQAGSEKTQVTYNSYDAAGRPTSITGKGEPLAKTYTYSHFGEVATETQGNFKKSYTYNDFQLVETSTDIDGQVTEYEYDPLMRIKTIKERCRIENTTPIVCSLFVPDETNQINERNDGKIEICGKKTNYTYTYKNNTSNNNTVNVENIYGCNQYNVTNTILDGLSRTTSTTKVEHAEVNNIKQDVSTSTNYNSRGLVESQTDEAGNTTTFAYYGDPLNRLHTITDAEGFITTKTYTANYINEVEGFNCKTLNKETTTDADGINTSIYTDRLGRVVAKKIHECEPECELNCEEECTIVCEQESITYTKYDDKSRVIQILPPGTTATNANLIYQYTYDGADNVTSKIVPDKGLVEYKYDDRNLQTAMRDRNIATNYSELDWWLISNYDNYGRLTKQGFGKSDQTINGLQLIISNFYDIPPENNDSIYQGKMHQSQVNILNGFGKGVRKLTTNYTLDDYGRVVKESWKNHLEQDELKDYEYDAADKITKVTHTIDDITTISTYTYDVQGRLVTTQFKVGDEEQTISKMTDYTLTDQPKTKTLGGGMQTLNYSYNKNNWLTGINKEAINEAGASLPVCPTVGSLPQNGHLSSENLFSMVLKYAEDGILNPRKNGNIAEMHWQVKDREADYYKFTYDYLNRLKSANSLNNYFNTAYTYDARGNIQTLSRDGLLKDGNCYNAVQIDDLKYTYYNKTNQLKTVVDLNTCDNDIIVDIDSDANARVEETGIHKAQKKVSSANDLSTKDKQFQAGEIVTLNPGFAHTNKFSAIIQDCNIGFLGGNPKILKQYKHDDNGNLTKDKNKGFEISYNYLNLPYQAVKDASNKIEWLYTADGRKLQKKTTVNDKATTKNYLEEIELNDRKLQAAYHSEGRYVEGVDEDEDEDEDEKWEFNLKDHLGNVRVVFTGKENANDAPNNFDVQIRQETHYYPFGMPISGPWHKSQKQKNDYLYNGMEYNTDLELNWSDYGARFYDPQIGRWTSVDPLAGMYVEHSPYNYVLGNPIKYIDPDGMRPDDVTIDERGDVICIDKKNEPHRLYLQEKNGVTKRILLNDPEMDRSQLDNVNIGQRIVHFLTPENVHYIMKDAGVSSWPSYFLSSIPELYSFSYGAIASHGWALDFGYSALRHQLLSASEKEVGYSIGVHPNDDYSIWDNRGGFIVFKHQLIQRAYNVPDAGNFLWGHAMTRLGASSQLKYVGSNGNEIFSGGDAGADQRSIFSGSRYAHRICEPHSNLFGYKNSRPNWFYSEGNSYGR